MPSPNTTVIVWEEIEEVVPENIPKVEKEKRRNLFSKDTFRSFDPSIAGWFDRKKCPLPKSFPPHPLRTRLWKLDFQWRGLARSSRIKYPYSTFLMELDPNGSARIGVAPKSYANATTAWIGTGTWTSSLSSRLEISMRLDKEQSIVHSIVADFHANPFGRQPKLTRGVVRVVFEDGRAGSKGRKRLWAKPIVATCSGRGIGEDTLDLGYKQRTTASKN